MSDALSETAVGRALLAFWADMPLWALANIILAASLLPSFTALLLGSVPLTIGLSFPAVFVVAGLTDALAQAVHEHAPNWRHLIGGRHPVTLSLWIVLTVLASSFLVRVPATVFVLQCVIAVTVLMLAPFVLCIPALYPVNVGLAWRNAFVVAVHYPLVALGLLALALILGWLVMVSKGSLFLVAPALWVSIAMYSTHEITHEDVRMT